MPHSTPTTVRPALFGWQGFSFEHPTDWAPVSLTGNRQEGYARLVSSGRTGCHVRWKRARAPSDLESRLASYLKRLDRDAKKAKESFKSERQEIDGRWTYRWQGAGQGRGVLFFSEPCARVFFLEAFGGRNDSLLPILKGIVDSFESNAADQELWSVLGVSLRLPSGFELDRKAFQAGKTQLTFRRNRSTLIAERWGLAEQLLTKHDLDAWSKVVLSMPRAESAASNGSLTLRQSKLLGKTFRAVVRHDAERNQLVLLKGSGRIEPLLEWLC